MCTPVCLKVYDHEAQQNEGKELLEKLEKAMKNQLNKGASGHARGFDSTFDRNAAEELGEGLAQQPQASTELASLLLSIKIQNDLQTQKTNEVLKG